MRQRIAPSNPVGQHDAMEFATILRPVIASLMCFAFSNGAWAASEALGNTADVPIPDNGVAVTSAIAISGAPAGVTVTGIDVSFACVHPNSGDLVVELRADSGGTLGSETLWNREGEGAIDPSGTRTGVATFNGLTANRTWYLHARDFVSGNSGHIDEWALTIYYDEPQCDVVVQGIPGISPNPVAPSQSIMVSYTIRNSGPADAGATQTKVQVKNSTGIQLTSATFADPPVAAGDSSSRSAAIPIPPGTPNGTYSAFVILDNLSALNQSDTSNDIAPGVSFTVDGSRCDIVVEGTPEMSPNAVTAGQSITVGYAIRNKGPADAGATRTMIAIKNSSGIPLTAPAFSEPALPAGGMRNQTVIVAIPAGTPAGTYTAHVILDSLDQLSQTSDVNDLSDPALFAVSATTSGAGGPDLAATGAPAVSPAAIASGETLRVDFSVRNIGSEVSLPVNITVDLVAFWGGSITSQTVGIGGLPAGASSGPLAVDLHVPGSTPSGVYSVRYIIDAAGLPQTNYGNDFSAPRTVRVSFSGSVAAGDLVEGIDVSHHEGVIDWGEVRLAGKEFAFIKATEGGTVAGFETHPAHFSENWPGAIAAGLAVGAYHFANPLRSPAWHNPSWSEPSNTVQEEAARFVEVARPALKPGFLPPGLDVEPHAVSYVWNPLEQSFDVDPAVGLLDPLDIMGAEALARWILDWCVEVERLSGTRPVLYITKSYATALAPYLADRYNLWVAAISDAAGQPETPAWGTWLMHQYDWFGIINPGIDDFVDLNVMRGPLSDRIMKNAELVSRGRFTVSGDHVLIEVAGAKCQRVPIQGSTDLLTWFDVAEIQLVNGFGELLHPAGGSTLPHFFRIRP